MQRLQIFSSLKVGLTTLFLLSACVPASAPGGANCKQGICVNIQLSEPISFNEPITATITVETDQDIPRLGVSLWADYGVLVEKPNSWQVETKSHQPVTFTGTVRFTLEGYLTVLASAGTPSGVNVADSIVVNVTRAGGTVNPIIPTGPSQAVPYTPQPTSSPTNSPLPTPPLTNSLLSPSLGQSVLVTGQDFEGTFPPAGWFVQDLSTDGKERYWGKTNYRKVSGSWAVWPARNGADGIDPAQGTHNYPNYMETRLIYGPFDVSDAGTAYAQFQLWREIELNYDYLAVEASHDGVTFQTVITRTGIISPTWAVETARFNEYAGDSSVWLTWRFYSDYAVTYDGPYVDDIYLWKYVPGEVSVRGSFAYADRAGQSQPARYMKAYLYDADPGGADDLLDETIVGSTGTFVFLTLRNWDVDGGANQTSTTGHLDLYIVWETEYLDSATARRRVTRFNDQAYQWNSGAPQTDIADGTADFNYQVPATDNQRQALWIFQDLRRGWDYIHDTTGADPGSATARWELNQNSLGICSASCFLPTWPQNGMFIAHASVNSSDVVVHELGHQYMYNAEGWQGIDCLTHSLFASINPHCAWSEGWSDFLPLAVNGDSCFDYQVGPCTGAADFDYFNLETHARGDGQPEGDAVEGRVAGALYDMFDAANDSYGQANFGFAPLWTIVGDNSPENIFYTFWERWGQQGYDKHYAVQAIYQNSIDYDTAPSMNLPDRNVLNIPASNVVDLRNHSSDQESQPGQLNWLLTSVSDNRCGVSLSGYYIGFNPASGFLGYCDVTISVGDGIKTGSDTFRATIVPVTARSFLPLILKSDVTPLQSPPASPSPFVSPLPLPEPFASPLPNPSS
jgi:hypothetical protein